MHPQQIPVIVEMKCHVHRLQNGKEWSLSVRSFNPLQLRYLQFHKLEWLHLSRNGKLTFKVSKDATWSPIKQLICNADSFRLNRREIEMLLTSLTSPFMKYV